MDGSEKYLILKDLQRLCDDLELGKKKIDEKMEKLKKSNYEQQKHISNEKFLQQYSSYSDFDSKVGVFSSFMFKFNKYFIIEYLNALIHGLAFVSKKYCSAGGQNVENLKIPAWKKKTTPVLISFKIGDLLRSKFSSNEK